MTKPLRSYDYVNHPYAAVRDAMRSDPLGIFQRATTVAAARSDELYAQLHAKVGPVEVSAEVVIDVASIEETLESPTGGPSTKVTFQWKATHRPGMFPIMHGVLSVYALTPTETQLDFEGKYDPPAGAVGRAFDAVAGHRIAEASVKQFIQEVAVALRAELTKQP